MEGSHFLEMIHLILHTVIWYKINSANSLVPKFSSTYYITYFILISYGSMLHWATGGNTLLKSGPALPIGSGGHASMVECHLIDLNRVGLNSVQIAELFDWLWEFTL